VTKNGTLFSIPCEAIINEHPDVYRSALVGIKGSMEGASVPAIIVEPIKNRTINKKKLIEEVKKRAGQSELTRDIEHFLIHNNFPVDIRHNAKIFREKLAIWAQKKISPFR
jgi:acyl-coenzyme A synthetase/AMP-(fatty) acid ligase